MLCEWIAENPHPRGSINGLAAQVAYALSAAPVGEAREGWRLVPLEPTEAMIDAACDMDAVGQAEAENLRKYPSVMPHSTAGQVFATQYRAAIAAAHPPSPAPEAGEWLKRAMQFADEYRYYPTVGNQAALRAHLSLRAAPEVQQDAAEVFVDGHCQHCGQAWSGTL